MVYRVTNMRTAWIFVAILTLCVGVPLGCPNVEDMRPCTCKRLAFGLQVICAGFNNSSSLSKALSILKDYKVQTILLHGLQMENPLPANVFAGMHIKEIRVEQSTLVFAQPAFTGLDRTLNILNVAKHSMITSNDAFSLAKLSELNELSMQYNTMSKVCNDWLNGKVPNAHKIELDNNGIKEIDDQAFSSLINLKIISLSQNSIQKVKRSMLPNPARYLERIDLSFNQITQLPNDFFYEMPQLREIILTQNLLTSLPENTWIPVWNNLNKLYLSRNNLHCDDGMNWIKDQKNIYLEAKCSSPKEYTGKDLKDVYFNT